MSIPKRPQGFRPGSLPLVLDELFGQMRVKGFDSSGVPQGIRVNGRAQLQFERSPGVTGTGTSKILGQSEPSADTETTVYTVPASTEATITAVHICNGGGKTQFDLGIAIGGGSLAGEDFFFENTDITSGRALTFNLNISLDATDVIRARSSSGAVVFSVWGTEWA